MEQGFRASLMLVGLAMMSALAAYTAWPGGDVPIHFDVDGIPDRFAGPFIGFFLLPIASAIILAIIRVAVRTEPAQENLKRTGHVFGVTLVAIFACLLVAQIAVAAKAFGGNIDIAKIVSSTIGILFCVIGNYLPKIKPNWTMGIRNRWTLSDEETWRRTHRFSGPIFVASGLALMVIPWMVDARVLRGTLFAVTAVIVIVPTVYSYIAWSRSKRAG